MFHLFLYSCSARHVCVYVFACVCVCVYFVSHGWTLVSSLQRLLFSLSSLSLPLYFFVSEAAETPVIMRVMASRFARLSPRLFRRSFPHSLGPDVTCNPNPLFHSVIRYFFWRYFPLGKLRGDQYLITGLPNRSSISLRAFSRWGENNTNRGGKSINREVRKKR